MLLVRREPDDVTRPDFLHWSTFALNPPATSHDDQRLTQWMNVPGGSGAGLERDAGATNARGVGWLE